MTTKGNAMNKAIAVLLLLTASSAGSLFASDTKRQRYLVGTRAGFTPRVLVQEIDLDATRVRAFRNVNGFAAELSEEEAQQLRSSRNVRFVELDPEKKALASALINASKTQSVPYGITAVNAPRLWNVSTGRKIKLAVIDSGIDRTHPDLAAVYKGGKDFADGDDDPTDDQGHGTHVAGTIAAINNGVGVIGVAPEVELYALRTLKNDGNGGATGTTASVIAAVDWAIENKMNIISLSLGSGKSSVLEQEAFQRAERAGVLAIAASGNAFGDPGIAETDISYPAAYDSVIAVGAIDEAQKIAGFSQRGPALDIVAPGVEVLSTFPVGFSKFDFIEIDGRDEVDARAMTGSPNREVSGTFIFAGLGRPQDFNSSMRGNIALIERGEFTFNEKVKNAMNAGAVAAIIFNRESGNFGGTLIGFVPSGCTPGTPGCKENPDDLAFPWIPTVSISQADGQMLRAMTAGTPITLKMGISADYEFLQGTSMATPHVSGAAAVIWATKPTATAAEVREAMLSTATDLGAAGVDNVFGHGVVNAFAGAQKLNPAAFGPPRKPRRR